MPWIIRVYADVFLISLMKAPKLLLVEDDIHFAQWASLELARHCPDLEVFVVHTLGAARQWLCGPYAGGLELSVVDLHLDGEDGVDLIVELTRDHPQAPVLVLTSVDTPHEALTAIRAGAQGYMLKLTVEGELGRAVQQVRQGGSPINPGIAHLLLTAFRSAETRTQTTAEDTPSVPADMLSVLSTRESDVLKLLARGYADKEVAAKLAIAPSTVDTHIRSIYRKFSVHSRSQLRRLMGH